MAKNWIISFETLRDCCGRAATEINSTAIIRLNTTFCYKNLPWIWRKRRLIDSLGVRDLVSYRFWEFWRLWWGGCCFWRISGNLMSGCVCRIFIWGMIEVWCWVILGYFRKILTRFTIFIWMDLSIPRLRRFYIRTIWLRVTINFCLITIRLELCFWNYYIWNKWTLSMRRVFGGFYKTI